MIKILAGILCSIFINAGSYAQDSLQANGRKLIDSAKITASDSVSVLSAFKKGRIKGMIRYFFMATDNNTVLTDYYANALGGGLRYETANFHGFQLAASLYSIVNIGSSDLSRPDAVTGQYNRYEIGLFDLEDPARQKDITRLEEAYLKYNFKKSKLVLGRQLINTPFINLQDGRMRPTAVEAVWVEWNEIRDLKIEAGWIYAMSPRSTTRWKKTASTIGIYPAGLNADGTKSQYYGNLNSDGTAIAGVTGKINQVKIQVWDLFAENIFNTAMLQADVQIPLKERSAIFASGQFIRQDALNKGGNPDPAKTYMSAGTAAMTFGAAAGWRNHQWETGINYNRITAHGRYLMPREWGRDPFFTFMPRERNEGFGDVHAFMAKVIYTFPQVKIKTSLSGGYFKLPDINNVTLNKYVMPSYKQLNFDTRYSFGKMFSGLDAQLLVVGKFAGSDRLPNAAVFNKVNMLQYNLVLNFHF